MTIKNNWWNKLDFKTSNYRKLTEMEITFKVLTHNEQVLTNQTETYPVSHLNIIFEEDSYSWNRRSACRKAMDDMKTQLLKDSDAILTHYRKKCEFINKRSIYKVLKTHIIGVEWDCGWALEESKSVSATYSEYLKYYPKGED